MSVSIRSILDTDLDQIVRLVNEFAAYESLLDHCEVTVERIAAAMFGERRFLEGLIALDGSRAVGYALFFPSFSSFRGHRGLFLDDIYITEEYRGLGLGERMLKEIAGLARERGHERIDFLVLDWNKPAIGFYEKLGAVRDPDERHFKFTDEAFDQLAK